MFRLLICALFIAVCLAGTPQQWKSRTIYQVLTDRFARSDGPSSPCDLTQYCGGDYSGLASRLDYIAGMGFDAIWISPIPQNVEEHDGVSGYHGYWMKSLDQLNAHFGSASDLKALVSACHARNIWVMVDVVCNHMGPTDNQDFSIFTPFNQAQYFHRECAINNWNNQTEVEVCWLSGLPDLNQDNAFVSSTLFKWIGQVMTDYGFDGIRMDTVPEVHPTFWTAYQQHVGNTYIVGEVYNGNVGYVSGYQQYLSGLLSYPLYFTLRNVFGSQQSMRQIESTLSAYKSFRDVGLLGAFMDNHDQPRFLSYQKDVTLYKAALVFQLMSESVPIVYYGTEQGFNGDGDPYNREAMWTSNYNTNTEMYQFLKQVIGWRKQLDFTNTTQVQRYADDQFYAYTRGNVFVAVTNVGTNGADIVRTITYEPFTSGTVICNLFWAGDCETVKNDQFTVTLLHGESKIFVPKSMIDRITFQ